VISIGGKRFPAFRLIKDDLTLDLWDREGVDLESDLERRDFTVNSIAVDVVTGNISDPFLGLADLERRLLRATTPASFSLDPLRVLRLVRLQAELDGFAIQPATAAAARREVSSLDEIAPERIRAELDLILRASGTAAPLARLQDLHIYPGLWLPEHPWKAITQDLGEPANRLAGFVEDFSSLTVSGEPVVDLQLARQTLLLAFLPLHTLRERLHALRSMKEAGYVTKSSASKLRTLLEQEELPGRIATRVALVSTPDRRPLAYSAGRPERRVRRCSPPTGKARSEGPEAGEDFGGRNLRPSPPAFRARPPASAEDPEGALIGTDRLQAQEAAGRGASTNPGSGPRLSAKFGYLHPKPGAVAKHRRCLGRNAGQPSKR